MFIRFSFTAIHNSWLHPLFLLTILAVFPLCTKNQNISINDSLTATETSTPWRSPNGDFAFGFRLLEDNANQLVLSIWFDKIPAKTIVWYERSSYPVPRSSTLRLQARDGLVLRDPQGSPLYNTSNDGSLGDEVANGFMQDNGNFVLTAAKNSSNILWESFRHPADTILPTQTIEINEMLISRKTQTNLAQGRFCARMNSTGNFFFSFKTEPSTEDFDALYYSSQSSNKNNASNSGFRVKFDETASISVETSDGRPVTYLRSLQSEEDSQNYYRATLDSDGVFALYFHRKIVEGNPRWKLQQGWPSDPDDICRITASRGSGACGYNSMCRVQNDRPVCECPTGFSLADPNNTHGDCKSDYVQNCIRSEEDEECSLTEIPGVNWPMYDYQKIPASTEQQCREACLDDYFCTAAVLGRSACWKKTLPITNGRNDQSATTFLKRGKKLNHAPQTTTTKTKREQQQKVLIVVGSVILGSSVLVNFFLTSAACLGFFPKVKFPVGNLARDTAPGSNLRCFTYNQLEQATDGFKDELGRGGFGIVYKGHVMISDDSRTTVAVKKLHGVAQDSEKEFRTEVSVIGQIHHKNVVRLLGLCDEGPNRLLVYEHMANGNLAAFLFGDPKPSWRQRTHIALGVARGLAYLHEECSTQIIHCDIKPQNILLDDNYTARISDFGLAKLLMLNQSRTVTNIRGTKGYVSPEWFRNTQITTKVDVYSFGVVLLEIISCRKAVLDVEFNPILTDWGWQCFLEGRLDTLVEYEDDDIDERDGEMVERFVRVGLWCIQEDADLRPTMRKTCQMLEGTVHVHPLSPSSLHTFNLVQPHPLALCIRKTQLPCRNHIYLCQNKILATRLPKCP